ncbi:UNVERIFIED_CONTAM: hypothetical protein GTU68_052955 [Idotea baltica]|nr:hypothetical protein [Idotea baltica]
MDTREGTSREVDHR